MSKELLLVVDAVANEKGVSREVIFQAMEAALASAAIASGTRWARTSRARYDCPRRGNEKGRSIGPPFLIAGYRSLIACGAGGRP